VTAGSLITPQDFNDIITAEDPQVSPDGSRIAFTRVDVDRVENTYRRGIWLAPSEGGPPMPFTAGTKQDSSPRWSPDGKHLAFVSTRGGEKPQIYIIPTDGGEARQLTNLPQGASNPAWSPDGKFVAFTSRANAEERKTQDSDSEDNTGEDTPRDEFEAKQRRELEEHKEKKRFDPRVVRRQPYRVGTSYLDDRRTHIYVIAIGAASPDASEKAKTPFRLTDGEVDYGPPVWSPDGTSILAAASRDPESNKAWIYQDIFRIPVPADDGSREKPVPLTEPGFCNLSPKPSPDGETIAYLRRPEEGIYAQVPRLVVIPADGGPPNEVTPGFDRGVDSFCWSPDGRALIFASGDEGDTGIYTVPTEGGIPSVLVSGRREVLAFDIASKNDQLGFVACTPERPPDLYSMGLNGQSEQRLTDFNGDFLKTKQVMPVEEFWYTASDGVEVQGWLIKPPGFDPTQTYPLAVEIHGGPHSMWGPSTTTMWHEWQCLAAR
jgi:dipeptidyl aminopeptidase/acylaminoacyl peptidase